MRIEPPAAVKATGGRKCYSELPESYVVMIGTFDLFGQNRHIYRFRNYEMSDKSLLLEDGTMKVFLNSRGTEDDISDELKNFLDLVNGLEPADDFCEELDREVRKAKQNAEVRRNYMDLEDKLRHERNRALKEGIEIGRIETLINLARSGTITLQMAAKAAEMSEAAFQEEMDKMSEIQG